MSDVIYDLNKLMEFQEFDKTVVQRYLAMPDEYYDRLNGFMRDYSHYLTSYNPIVVIYGEEVQKDFLSELDVLKNNFLSLGIKMSATELTTLEEAVYNENEKGLSDGLVKFHAKLNIIANQLKAAQIRRPSNNAAPGPVMISDKPIIIAVDDSLLILNIIKEMIGDEYRIIALTNGEDALLAAERNIPNLFLLDIEMPVMDGHELVKRIKSIDFLKNIPILFLTSNATRQHVFTAKEQGVKDYILKPVDRDMLLYKIRKNITMVW